MYMISNMSILKEHCFKLQYGEKKIFKLSQMHLGIYSFIINFTNLKMEAVLLKQRQQMTKFLGNWLRKKF